MKRMIFTAIVAIITATTPATAAPAQPDPLEGEWNGFYYCKIEPSQPVSIYIERVAPDESKRNQPPIYTAIAVTMEHPSGYPLNGVFNKHHKPTFVHPDARDAFPEYGVWSFTPKERTHNGKRAPAFTVALDESGVFFVARDAGRSCGPYKHGLFAMRRPKLF